MEQFSTFEAAQNGRTWEAAWVAIGVFDGIHLGHQAILQPMAARAHAAGAAAVVVTFQPHPLAVLRGPEAAPPCLTTPQERAELLGALGMDAVVTLRFDHDLAALTAQEFMQRSVSSLRLEQLWAGEDFALGRNRQGTLPVLREIGAELGYSVHVTAPVAGNNERISSSRIRALVGAGQVREAAAMLGRNYSLEGPVVRGDGRGRGLGFPTANVAWPATKLLPAYGVYATWTWAESRRLASVTSVGVRPTFDGPGAPPRVEAYIMDTDENLYGQPVRVEFLEFLRPELRFDSAQALIDQMVQDTADAREVLSHAAGTTDLPA